MSIKQLEPQNFTDFLDNNKIAVVDFWAEWCAPCLAFAKIFDKVASEYKDIGFGKVDIESYPELSELFQVRSIPHLLIFKEGVAIYSESGSMPESTLIDLIEQAILVDVSDVKSETGGEET